MAQQDTLTFASEGLRLHAVAAGPPDGPVVILLHGPHPHCRLRISRISASVSVINAPLTSTVTSSKVPVKAKGGA